MADTEITDLTLASGTDLTNGVEAYVALAAGTIDRKVSLDQLRGLGWEVITDHGAGTGETAADNTTAIHAARTAAGVDGRGCFPAGTFAVNKLLPNIAGQTWHLAADCTLSTAVGVNSDGIEKYTSMFTTALRPHLDED